MFILGALMSGTVIYANGTSNLPGGIPGKTTKVSFPAVKDGARLFIKDSNDITLYSEEISHAGEYAKRFDFSNLPEGNYYFEVDMKDSIRIYPFSVSDAQVEMMEQARYSIAKPEIEMRGDKLFLTRDAAGKQAVKVDLFYEGRELAYSEQMTPEGDLKRVYDFSTSKRGDYLVVIETGDRVFRENVRVKGTYW